MLVQIRRFLAVGLLVASLVACGGSDAEDDGEAAFADVLAQVEGLRGKERMAKLAELAEAEGGELTFYTSMAGGDDDAVAEAFGDVYDIDVSVYRADSETLQHRLIEEADAGFRGADVVDGSGVSMIAFDREGLLVPYDPENDTGVAAERFDDTWTPTRMNTFVISWNTNLVKRGEQPRSWEELAEPRWQGKLALEAGDHDWMLGLWRYWVDEGGKTDAEARRLFEAIGRNALVVNGHTLMGQLLAAGEFEVAATNYRHVVERLRKDGAPIAWRPAVEPAINRIDGVGLVRNARHPAAALLFVEWWLSDGQEVLVELGREPARQDTSTRAVESTTVDVDLLAEEGAEWEERYEEIVRLGREVEGG